jgi:phosphoribosylglycinamide formyltransferase-1|tara:strand:+ start:325 stop:933 length:609 start_codon:yes stop_codon:yes gene_type:complete
VKKKFTFVVLISGSGTNLQALIDATFKGTIEGELSHVISNNPDAYGLVRAKNAAIPYSVVDNNDFDTREDFDLALIKVIDKINPNLIVLAGFMRILSPIFIRKFKSQIINIHPSLLPKYPGLKTHQKVIDNKDKKHGVTIHFVDESLDGGPICAQSIMDVTTQNVEILEEQIHNLEHALYPVVVSNFSKGLLSLKNGKVIIQ